MKHEIKKIPCKPEFQPFEVRITVENKKELNYLCAALNISAAGVAEHHSELETADVEGYSSMKLWRELEAIRKGEKAL